MCDGSIASYGVRRPCACMFCMAANGGIHSPSSSQRLDDLPEYEVHLPLHAYDNGLINAKLPSEIIQLVFVRLDIASLCRCAQVCKLWNNLALDGNVWQHVDLFHFQIAITGRVFRNIATRCRGFLRILSLNGCQALRDSDLVPFIGHCSRLKELNLQGCNGLTSESICELSRHCHDLEKLNISNGPLVTDRTCAAIAVGCKRLEHLDISWCNAISDNGILTLVKGLPGLKVMKMKGCSELITVASLKYIGRHCPHLLMLNVANIATLLDPGISQLAAGCNELQQVCLSSCPLLTDRALVSLAEHCPRLRSLEVAGCELLTDIGFQSLFPACPNLQRLDMEECYQIHDLALRCLADSCHNLRWLSLSHCGEVTNEGICHLANSMSRLTLQVLELDNIPALSDHVTGYILRFPHLQKVDLYDCAGITQQGVDFLQRQMPGLNVHSYFAPSVPPEPLEVDVQRRRRCRACCVIS